MTYRTWLRSSAVPAAVVASVMLSGGLPPASAGPAPATWMGLSSTFGINGMLDLDTRTADLAVRNVSGDIALIDRTSYTSRTEITSAGSTVVVEAVDGSGARVTSFGQAGRLRFGDSGGTTRAVALEVTVRGQLLVVNQRIGASGALEVMRLDATTGLPDAAFGVAGVLRLPGAWDGTSVSPGDAGDLFVATNDVSSRPSRGLVLHYGEDGMLDTSFAGGDGRIDAPLGQAVIEQRTVDVAGATGGVVVGGIVDGQGVVAVFDQFGAPDAAAGDQQRRVIGDRVDAVAIAGRGVVVASVSGRTGSLSRLGWRGEADGPTTVVVDQGCDVAFPDLESQGVGHVFTLVDDGCGRGAQVQHYDAVDVVRYPRDEVAPELDRLRPVVARRLAHPFVVGDRAGDATGATVACIGMGRGTTFVPLQPARVLDTRTGLGAPRAVLGAQRSLVLDLTGVAGVPADGVAAVTLNLTAVGPTASGYLSVFPSGTSRPVSSTLNTQRGVVTPSHVTAKLGADGKVIIYNSAGSVHVLADVAGYHLEGNDGRFTPITPRRVLDTRTGTGARVGRVAARGALRLDLAAAGVPAGADAAVLNVTAVMPSAASFITAYSGGIRPLASQLNTRPGVTVPNLVTVKLAPDGSVMLYNEHGNVHLLADLAGWYSHASDDHFVPLAPLRMLDTRNGTGGTRGAVGPGSSVSFPVADSAGVPAGASAVLLNVTAVAPTAGTHLTAFPATSVRPTASNINVPAGVTQANHVVVPLGNDGNVAVYNHNGSTHVLADVAGYYVLDPLRLTS